MHTDTSTTSVVRARRPPAAPNTMSALVPTSERYSPLTWQREESRAARGLASPGVSSARTAGRTECLLPGPRARRALGPTDSDTVASPAGIEQRSEPPDPARSQPRGRHRHCSGFQKTKGKTGDVSMRSRAARFNLRCRTGRAAGCCSSTAAPAPRFNARHAPDLLPLAPGRPPARSPGSCGAPWNWNGGRTESLPHAAFSALT